MKVFLIFLFAINLLFAQNINQKFILSGDKNKTAMKIRFNNIKDEFKITSKLDELKEKNNLVLKLESLGDFSVVTLSPIKTLQLKNELLLELKSQYLDIFAINITPKKRYIKKKMVQNETHSYLLTLEWLVFILISIISTILIGRAVVQLYKIKKLQGNFKIKQKRMEEEIKNLGDTDE